MAKSQTPDPTTINLIGEGSEVEGTFKCTNDVRVNGRIKGDLHAEGKVIVAEKGVIEGKLIARSADVAGKIDGDLLIEDRLVLKGSADVDGSIRTGRLVVEEGAKFEGSCTMGRLDPARKASLANGQASRQVAMKN